MSTRRSPVLSVVVIARNEEEQIGDCLASIFRACEAVDSFEVILVDSNSADRTVEVAKRHPIDVYSIPDDDLSSIGAGRYVGAYFASGEYLLFVDGDMILEPGWIDEAIDLLGTRSSVAGVTGWLADQTGGPDLPEGIRSAEAIHGGLGLFDRAAYQEIGGVDPRLRGCEDCDLSVKLRDADYELLKLPVVAAIHETPDPLVSTAIVRDKLRRLRAGYDFGTGQLFRKHVRSPRRTAMLYQMHESTVRQAAWFACSLVVLLLSLTTFAAWLVASVVTVMILFQRSELPWYAAAGSTLLHVPSTLSAIHGFIDGGDTGPFPIERVVCETRSSAQPHGGG